MPSAQDCIEGIRQVALLSVQHRSRWLDKDRSEHRYLYFIRCGKNGPIKIGIARDPQKRLVTLQIGNPRRLVLIGTLEDCADLERRLHEHFAADHIGGEWFRPSKALRTFIRKATARH